MMPPDANCITRHPLACHVIRTLLSERIDLRPKGGPLARTPRSSALFAAGQYRAGGLLSAGAVRRSGRGSTGSFSAGHRHLLARRAVASGFVGLEARGAARVSRRVSADCHEGAGLFYLRAHAAAGPAG